MTIGDVQVRSLSNRRTVRIVKPRSVQRVATLTMLGFSSLAFLIFLGFKLVGNKEAVPLPANRGLEDVHLNWRCEAGHAFRAPGKAGQGVCAKCSGPAFPTEAYDCRQHGTISVSAKFEIDAGGEPRVAQFRVAGKEWLDSGTAPKCPKCGLALERRPRDPLAGLERSKRKDTRPPREATDDNDGPVRP